MNIISRKYYISLFLITTSLLSTPEISYATDTINTSLILRDSGSTLISSGGNFELGFFSPQNSKNRYLGIWYKKISVSNVVWVANRDNPLKDESGTLRVVEPGRLVLLNATNDIIWSTNTSRKVQTPVAQLLDLGNLVVKDAGDNNPENFLWQSFNYPTDTLLPGMNLGWNLVTGLEVYITSWKNRGDPASGDYTYHCDRTGYPHLAIKKRGILQFRTGPWNGVGFSGNPNLQRNPIFTFGIVINKSDEYYYVKLHSDSVVSKFTLNENGVAHRWVWDEQRKSWTPYFAIPDNYCDMYKRCGPYSSCNVKSSSTCECLNKFERKDPQGWDRGDWSNGCNRSTPLNCQKGDVFLKYSGIKLPDTRNSGYNNSMTLDECRVFCSKNCSCTAYTSLNISSGNGCLFWFGELVDMRDLHAGQDIYIRMASSELESEGRKRKIFIATLSLAIAILLLSLSLLYLQKRKKLDHQLPKTGRERLNYINNNHDESHEYSELPLFDLSTITKATNNFSIDNKLGEGGFGPVYKGLLEEGHEIAVKRLSRTSLQGGDEFKNELICIGKLQHRNLVKLLGWCIQGEEKMLVYEYMTNKSLDSILFDREKSMLLDWPRRFNIINGIVRGLLYLHQDSRLRVIHRDLKASNILLDSDMNPKISDFGLARTFGGNDTGGNTNRVVGTYGYMSPEYAVEGVFSVKSDVFSFGVLVLEIVSGKRNRGFSNRHHHLNLLGHAWMLHREERSLELVDSCLKNSCDLSEVLRLIQIGLLCVQEYSEDRPTMSSVVQMLSNDTVLPEAKHPGFFTGRETPRKTETSVSLNTASSQNEMTISLMDAR